MKLKDLKGKKVLVMGLGVLGGGVGVAKFLAQNKAKVTVSDLKTEKELLPSLKKLKKFKIRYVLGRHEEIDFKTHDLIIKNPAVPHDSSFLKIAQKSNVPILMESSLFFQLSPTKHIIGVTGTKGKTTTTFLIGEILKKASIEVFLGGNLQISMLELLSQIKKSSWVVLELSSWQLEGLESVKVSPHIAVITNIMPDHLDRYSNMAEYVRAKEIIFRYQKKDDLLVINGKNLITQKMAKNAKSKVIFFDSNKLPTQIVSAIELLGKHNLSNVAAAYQVAKILAIDDKTIAQALKKFDGVKDRLEKIAKIKGIAFINDTTATTPEATVAALESLKRGIILICGGADKSLDFKKLNEAINLKVKAVVLLEGSATDKIERGIKKNKILGRFSDFKYAIWAAYTKADKGDLVLLSPACASFGMFKNEFDRGDQFRKIVKNLSH